MTISQPNPEVQPTGEEAGEFLDPVLDEHAGEDGEQREDGGSGDAPGEEDHGTEPDPTARPTGSPPVQRP